MVARNVEYEACVRRAAAIEPIPIPPVNPTNKTIDRQPPQLRRKVATKQYHAIRRTCRFTAAFASWHGR